MHVHIAILLIVFNIIVGIGVFSSLFPLVICVYLL